MKENISWDQSLVKKYSSSNHYKLLNQLRNEVKKYPLNKKKNNPSNISNNKHEDKTNVIKSNSQDTLSSKNISIKKEVSNPNSTVSFNNSKNFSIYNNLTNDSTKEGHKGDLIDGKSLKEDSSSSTFNDRLNQVDMK